MLLHPRPYGVLKKIFELVKASKKIEFEVSYADLQTILDMVFELLYREGWLKERPVLTKTIIQALEHERISKGLPRSDDGVVDIDSYSNWPPSMGSGYRGSLGWGECGGGGYLDPPEEPERKKDVISTGDLIQNHVRKLKGSGAKAKRPQKPTQHTDETLDGHAEGRCEDEADQKASLKRKKRGDGEW
jgi:hypothetical protein